MGTFGEITWKYKIDELINKYFDILNEINNKESYLTTIKTTNLSNELFETLKIIENCTSCKDKKIDRNDLDEIENCLAELKKNGILSMS